MNAHQRYTAEPMRKNNWKKDSTVPILYFVYKEGKRRDAIDAFIGKIKLAVRLMNVSDRVANCLQNMNICVLWIYRLSTSDW